MTPEFESAVGGMADIPQWFVWRLEWDAAEGKFRKTPCALDGSVYRISGGDPENWKDYDTVAAAVTRLNAGTDPALRYAMGFWLTEATGYWFLDIDMRLCGLPEYQATDYAMGLVNHYPGAFVEWSSSRKGLHIIGSGPLVKHRNKPDQQMSAQLKPLDLEFYSDGRGIAFGLDGKAQGRTDSVHDVRPLLAQLFPPREERDSGRRPEWRGPSDDDALVQKMLNARVSADVAFNGKAGIAQLLRGEVDKNSSSDMALAAHLAFWTGCDEPRIERIMRERSKMYREKWDSPRPHGTYLTQTIAEACAGTDNVYQEPERKVKAMAAIATPSVKNARDLQRAEFQPIQWALQDLLPEGVTILSSDPKLGKSWMVYAWCIAIATGKPIWEGRPPEQAGDALLLALEDNDRRMRRRLDKLLPTFGDPDIGRLYYACDWPRGTEGVSAIRDFLLAHPDTRIVVIDTIAAFRNADPGRKNAYTWDYEVGALLKPLSQEFKCAFVLVSHNRKAGNGDAHVNQEVSGTAGLVGGVDNVFVLKRSSGHVTAVLHTDGRDIEDQLELALQLHDGRWQCVGNARDINRSQQRSSVLEALARVGGAGTAREIHEAMGAVEKIGTLRVRLTRMVSAGEIELNGSIYTRLDVLARFNGLVTPQLMQGVTVPGVTPL